MNNMYESSVYVKCYYWLMDNYPEIHEEWEIALSKHTKKREASQRKIDERNNKLGVKVNEFRK